MIVADDVQVEPGLGLDIYIISHFCVSANPILFFNTRSMEHIVLWVKKRPLSNSLRKHYWLPSLAEDSGIHDVNSEMWIGHPITNICRFVHIGNS